MKRAFPLLVIIGLCLWSIASLTFYRSNAGHGPDMVGEEVFGFALPLLMALMVSVTHVFMEKLVMKGTTRQAILPLLAVLALAGVEIGVYCAIIVRWPDN